MEGTFLLLRGLPEELHRPCTKVPVLCWEYLHKCHEEVLTQDVCLGRLPGVTLCWSLLRTWYRWWTSSSRRLCKWTVRKSALPGQLT